MHKIYLLPLLSFLTLSVYGQKVDIDKFTFNTKYHALPSVKIEPGDRKYFVEANVGSSLNSYLGNDAFQEKIIINGWQKVDKENALVKTVIELEDFISQGAKTSTSEDVKKDKDGNVISRTKTYSLTAAYKGKGRARVLGPQPAEKLTQKELAKIDEKQEKVSSNPFLANVEVKKDEPKDQKVIGLGNDLYYEETGSVSTTELLKNYNANSGSILDNKLRAYVDGTVSYLNSYLNRTYGFSEISDRDYLWIVNTKDHAEYKMQQDAIFAVTELFKSFPANQPIVELRDKMVPLLQYFESLPSKYKDSDKGSKKIAYAAMYNLSKIYYYLDDVEKAKYFANQVISQDYDKKDGQKLLKTAEELQALFKESGFTTRHIITE